MHHFRMYETAMYYQNDGKKSDASLSQMFFSVRQSCWLSFFPADNPMDWIYSKTLEYLLCYEYIRYVYYITYTYIYIYSIAYLFSSLGTHWISTLHQGSILSTYKRKQWELVQSHFLDTQKIQIHKIWDTKTRCKPGTLSNQFKMDAWCNNHFSCEDSKSSNWKDHLYVNGCFWFQECVLPFPKHDLFTACLAGRGAGRSTSEATGWGNRQNVKLLGESRDEMVKTDDAEICKFIGDKDNR